MIRAGGGDQKFAAEKPELVAKCSRVYARVDFMIDNPRNPPNTWKYFREKCGINLSDETCLKEFELRRSSGQTAAAMYERKDGKMSTVDKWMDDLQPIS